MKTFLFLLFTIAIFAQNEVTQLSEIIDFSFNDTYGNVLADYENSQYKLTQLGDDYLVLKNMKVTSDSLKVTTISLKFTDGYLTSINLEFTGKEIENAKKIKKMLLANKSNFVRNKNGIICDDFGVAFIQQGSKQIVSIVNMNQ